MKGFKGIVHVPSSTFCSCSRSLPLSLRALSCWLGEYDQVRSFFFLQLLFGCSATLPQHTRLFSYFVIFCKEKIRFYVTFLFDRKSFFLFIGKKKEKEILFLFFFSFLVLKGKKTLKKNFMMTLAIPVIDQE